MMASGYHPVLASRVSRSKDRSLVSLDSSYSGLAVARVVGDGVATSIHRYTQTL
jgi:hypothetical protein